MRRKGKIKYKDVVKKNGYEKSRINKKSFKQRKSYSLYKTDYNKRNSQPTKNPEIPAKKRRIIEEKIDEQQVQGDNSSSEEEINELNNLINTFKDIEGDKRTLAIESSSESDDQDENLELTVGENISDSEKKSEQQIEPLEDENDKADEFNEDVEIDLELENSTTKNDDTFVKHFLYDIHDFLLDSLQKTPIFAEFHVEHWPVIGTINIQIPRSKQELSNIDSSVGLFEKNTFASEGSLPKKISKSKTLEELHIKSQIIANISKANSRITTETLSPLQAELFAIINNYQDLYYPHRTFLNSEEIRFIYCLHAVNHILKTRTKIIHHNAKLSTKDEVPDEFRDQGLVRPKVLILLPFKDAAYKVVMIIIQLILSEDKGNVINKSRFVEDYTGNELILPRKNPKPEDYEQIFQGNTNDDFKIGITVTKKSLKLYADFYSSDIILASPLGLRTIIGAEGETERDYDFLASIELLILDQADLFLMQNWDHIIHIFNHLHLQPKDSHGTDFSRIRSWSLNGWSKYYRQTLIFSSLVLPEINAIFNKRCCNFAGKVKVCNPIQLGCIGQVVVQVPHIFQKFDCPNVASSIEKRFEFFISKVLPQQKENLMKQTLIFIPSYFDYVRIRNYFKKEDIGFVQICEYSKEAKVARARDMFFHSDAHFLLYTERYHFFNRKRIKGIRHIVFYQPPIFPHFYSEICNLMQEANQNRKGNHSNMSVTVVYSKYDIHQLSAIVGTEKSAKMCQSDRKVHLMVTGND